MWPSIAFRSGTPATEPDDPYESPEYRAARDRLTSLLSEREEPFSLPKIGFWDAVGLNFVRGGPEKWYQSQVDAYNSKRQGRQDDIKAATDMLETFKPHAPMYSPGGLYDRDRRSIIPGTEPRGKADATDRYLHGGDDLYDTITGKWIQNPSPSGAEKKSPWPMTVPPGYNVIAPDKSGKIGTMYTAPGGKPVVTPEQEIENKVNEVWLEAYQNAMQSAMKDNTVAGMAMNDPTTLQRQAEAIANNVASAYRARITPKRSAVEQERGMWSPAQPGAMAAFGAQGQPQAGAGQRPAGAAAGAAIDPNAIPPPEDTAFWEAVEQRTLQLMMTGLDEEEAADQALAEMMDFLQQQGEGLQP